MATDAISSKKYYYFIRLMGRAASHITAEVALATHPNVTVLGEDIEARKMTVSGAQPLSKADFAIKAIRAAIQPVAA